MKIPAALVAAPLALAAPALAGTAAVAPAPTAAPAPTGMISFSLIEALAALRQPELAGIFSFVSERDAPFAFADYLARDKKALNLYLDKLGADFKAAQGLAEWDHEACASLINLYSTPVSGIAAPDAKTMKRVNDCMLAPTLPLEQIAAKRRK